MKIQYSNEWVQKIGMVNPTTFVYQFIYYERDNVDTNIIKYFIMHGLGLFIKVDRYVAHMFYEWSFSHNISDPISIKKNKYFLSLNTKTNVFDC